MFQNVADMSNQNEEVIEKSNKIYYRLKEIFKYQNIIIYILTFLVSTLSIKGGIMPFGLSIMAACVGESVPIVGVFISAILGTCVGGGSTSLINFLEISVVYFIFVLIFRGKIAVEERNEEVKTGGKLFAACFIVSLIKNFVGVFLIYDVFMGIISSAIVYVFYKIFVNGLATIRDFNEKKAFTIEELIATAIIVSLASTVFNNISVFSLNLSNIVIIFIIMVLGWKNGMLLGAVSGISIGLATSFLDGTSFTQISMFAISGILSGLLNRFGKIGVIAGFLLGNAILTYWVRGATTMIIYFREVFIASIGLLLVPSKVKIDIEEFFGKDKLLDDSGDRRLESKNEDVSKKLKTISEMFNQLMNSADKEEIASRESFIQDFLDNLEEVRLNIFYEEISNEDTGIARDICAVLIENEIIVDKDLIEILKEHNNYVLMRDENIKNDLQEIVKIANRTLKIYQINKAKEQERKNTIDAMNENLKGAVKIIDKCAEEVATESKESKFSKKEKELEILFKNKNIKIDRCEIKQLKNEKYIIELKCNYADTTLREKKTIANIIEIISKSLETKVAFQRERINEEKKEYYQIYASEDKFVLQVGSGKITKEGSEISGDCSLQIKLADGKYLLAIADGMGSGEKAREYSKITLRLIKQMLSAGFESEESVKMINSRISYLGASKRYSTLDVSVLDLFTGKAEFIKNAACCTYIKNKKNIKQVKSENLPIGMLNNIELTSQKLDLADGDILVMCSDGILDSMEDMKEDWIEYFLKNLTTTNVQKIADLILAEAVDNSFGVVKDDMTVIVIRIIKRK